MDKNIIENIIKWMSDEAEIQGRKVNHSVRKTAITTFVYAGIPPTLVQQHSGHKNLASIKNYQPTKGNVWPTKQFLRDDNGLHEESNELHLPGLDIFFKLVTTNLSHCE